MNQFRLLINNESKNQTFLVDDMIKINIKGPFFLCIKKR